jgi:type III restriction enzyme
MEMGMSASLPPMHVALDYCARKLMAALESSPRHREDRVLAHGLTPTTARLLRWWFASERCRTRVDNFNAGQRQAILHTVVAHELLRSDDPERLYRLACDPARMAEQVPVTASEPAGCASYVLRLAPGCGLRWVAQALLLWQWANHAHTRACGIDDARFSDRLTLQGADARIGARLQEALFGPIDGHGDRDILRSSLLRHAQLFLPPPIRPLACAWLTQQAAQHAQYSDDLALCVGSIASPSGCGASLKETLINSEFPRARDGARADQARKRLIQREWTQAWPESRTSEPRQDGVVQTFLNGASAIVLETGIGSNGLTHADPGHLPHRASLRIDLRLSEETPVAAVPAISEFPLARAIRHGAVKLPMLEPTGHLALPRLRTKPSRGHGLRPALSPAHRQLLHLSMRALKRRELGFAPLDPSRRPRLLVLCDAAWLLRAARRMLIESGLNADDIAMPGSPRQEACHALIDSLDAYSTSADARICVIAVLRTQAADIAPSSIFAAGLGLLWPEPDFAGAHTENRERAALGRMPDTLIDVLSIVEHPQCHDHYAGLLHAGLMARGDSSILHDDTRCATGDLFASPLRESAAEFDIPLPPPHVDGSETGNGSLLAVPLRILRMRRAMPVRKSPYCHEAWSEHDSGLRRAFLECAESDPLIESHCLVDPRRHGIGIREALLAQDPDVHGWPDALVRTADAVYLVVLSPSCPPHTPAAGERALAQWCAHANAVPHIDYRRLWRPVQLQAPRFWSWKRGGSPLSALLAALADAAPPADRCPSPSPIV